MTDRYEELSELLADEYDIYRKLYNLSLEKEKVISEEKIDKLNSIVSKERKLIENANKLEEKREEFEGEAGQAATDNLINIRDEIINLAAELKEQNLLNYKLVRDKLQLTNMNISVVTGEKNTNTYNNKGKYNNNQHRKMLNHKA